MSMALLMTKMTLTVGHFLTNYKLLQIFLAEYRVTHWRFALRATY